MSKNRPEVLSGKTYRIKTECGNFYLTLNKDEEEDLIEVKITLGKSGNCIRGLLEHIAILYSTMLQNSTTKEEMRDFLTKHTIGINCGCSFIHNEVNYKSCLDYVGQIILKELE